MSTVIFKTENAVFKFALMEVKERLISKKTEYVPDKIARLLELISTDTGDTLFNPEDHHYFGFVVLDLISTKVGTVKCKNCQKNYDADQLNESTVGLGKGPFNINQKQKGGFSLFKKRKNPSMFGGKGFTCPESHILISMETWKT